MLEFKTPEFGEWRQERSLFSQIFRELNEISGNDYELFVKVDSLFKLAFAVNSHMDYDYPFRAAEFVFSVLHSDQCIKIAAMAYVNSLIRNVHKNNLLGEAEGRVIKDMLLLSLITGQKPKTVKEVYGGAS